SCGSAALFWRITRIRSRSPRQSVSSPRSTLTSRAAWARRFRTSWPARPSWGGSPHRRRRCSMKAAAR
ncbi:hypothetical protein BwSH17_73430, partial [Bradyrhizobium ottawaense]